MRLTSSNRPLPRRSPGMAAVGQAGRIFPNVTVRLQDADIDRSLRSRNVASHTIAHLVTPSCVVDASGRLAAQAGFGGRFKLIWQLAGAMRYQDAHRSFALRTGEMAIMPMAWTYNLEMDERFEALVLVFDPASGRNWRETAQREMGRAIPARGAIAASAAGAAALLRFGRPDSTDVLAVQSLVDMVLGSLDVGADSASPEPSSPPCLFRARLLIGQNIGDESYGPDRLARDLGLSRRSLYNRFGRMGMTPANFIQQQRLARARAEILSDPDRERSLVTIALRNGFSDSSSFSRSFKAAYGITPSEFRTLKTSA
jgi:AraC-like DNA-binding protein